MENIIVYKLEFSVFLFQNLPGKVRGVSSMWELATLVACSKNSGNDIKVTVFHLYYETIQTSEKLLYYWTDETKFWLCSLILRPISILLLGDSVCPKIVLETFEITFSLTFHFV